MQSSKEKIEAQLCGYIDGELDDAERTEIEKHLDANPQHKALISELRAASGLLKDLPRAKVPGDLNEGLTGQLERSVLLNPSDEESGDAALRIRRWPQFTAVAAVLLLATGLAFVVYYALPGSQNNHGNQVALDDRAPRIANPKPQALGEREVRLRTATTADTRGRAADGSSQRFADAEGRKEAMDRAAAKPADSLAESTEGIVERGYKAKGAVQDGVTTDALALNSTRAGQLGSAVATSKEVEELQKRMRDLGGEADGDFNFKAGSSLYLVVSTKNAAVAGNQINAFFKDNGIPHMTPEVGAVAQSNLADDRRDTFNFRYKDASEATPSSEPARSKAIYAEKGDAPAQNPAAGAGVRGEEKDQLAQVKLRTADSDLARKPAAEVEAPAAPDKKMIESKVAKQAEPDQKRGGTDTAPGPQSDVLAKLETQRLRPEPDAAAREAIVRRQLQQKQEPGGLAPSGRAPIEESKDAALGKKTAGGAGGLGDESYWRMRRAGEPAAAAAAPLSDDVLSRGTMIVARMNRRQASELSATLSSVEGQVAQLKQLAPIETTAQGAVTLGLQDAVDKSKTDYGLGRQFGIVDPGSAAAPAPAPAASQPIAPRDVRANLALRDPLGAAKEPGPVDQTLAAGIRPEQRAAALNGAASTNASTVAAVPAPATRPTELSRENRGIGAGGLILNSPAAPAVAVDAKNRAANDPLEDPVDVYIVVKDQAPAAAMPPLNGAPAINSQSPATESDPKPAK